MNQLISQGKISLTVMISKKKEEKCNQRTMQKAAKTMMQPHNKFDIKI